MTPNSPTGPTASCFTPVRLHARCLFHPLREGAALCPHCRGTFCRECVTDEDNRLACPPCLRRLARSTRFKVSAAREFWQALVGAMSLAALAVALLLFLRWRV